MESEPKGANQRRAVDICVKKVEDFAFGSGMVAAALASNTTIPEVEDDLDVIGLPDH